MGSLILRRADLGTEAEAWALVVLAPHFEKYRVP